MRCGHQRTRRLRLQNVFLWSLLLPLFTGMAGAQASADLPKGQAQIEKGRDAVGQACVACHTNIVRMVQIHKESPAEWRDTVYSMIGRGAQLSPDEIESVIAYLSANGGIGTKSAADTPQEATRGGRGGGQQTAESDGRAILQRSCQQCHDLTTASTKKASEDWSQVIAKMIAYGAKLGPADQQKLTEYLNGIGK